ncbi:hypothetical protein CFC21_002783, partial [Triticum aestivum]
LLNRFL